MHWGHAQEARNSPDHQDHALLERRRGSPSAPRRIKSPSSSVIRKVKQAKTKSPPSSSATARRSQGSPQPAQRVGGGSNNVPVKASRAMIGLKTTGFSSQSTSTSQSRMSPKHLADQFLNMSREDRPTQMLKELQNILRSDAELQSEVQLQKGTTAKRAPPTSSDVRSTEDDIDCNVSDGSDALTECLPYASGNASELQLRRETDGYCVQGLDDLSEDAMETLIVSLSCALSQRRTQKDTGAEVSTAPKPKGPKLQHSVHVQPSAECVEEKSVSKQKSKKTKGSDVVIICQHNARHQYEDPDEEVESITGGGEGPLSQEQESGMFLLAEKRPSAHADKMFRSRVNFSGNVEDDDLTPNDRFDRWTVTVQEMLPNPRKMPPLVGKVPRLTIKAKRAVPRDVNLDRHAIGIHGHLATPDKRSSLRSITSPRSAFDDLSSCTSGSCPPSPR